MSPQPVAGLCEDDDELRGAIRDALERDGFTVRATASGAEAVRRFGDEPPDVLVLDIGLPDADGRDVCAALRARGVRTRVLFLTARDTLTDRLTGFDAGGDDYLAKPFALAELLARLHALLRRGRRDGSVHMPSGLQLDPGAHAVRHGDREMPLTPTEFRLLAALAQQPGAIVRRSTLVNAAWPDGSLVPDNTLDAYVARIRRKLRHGGVPDAIETVRGSGYRLR